MSASDDEIEYDAESGFGVDVWGSPVDGISLHQTCSSSNPADSLRLRSVKSKSDVVPSPLPLMSFSLDPNDIEKARTITGENIETIRNDFKDSIDSSSNKNTPAVALANSLQDPCTTRALAKWFMARSQRELLYRQSLLFCRPIKQSESDSSLDSLARSIPTALELPLTDIPIFERELGAKKSKRPPAVCICQSYAIEAAVDEDAASTPARSSSRSPPISPICPACVLETSVTFESEFESGNLQRASRVENRDALMISPRAKEFLHQFLAPTPVDQEYDLSLQKDVYTSGNIQWYYFRATSPKSVEQGGRVNYPLTVRFHIINMQKSEALYNFGMKPALLAMSREDLGWQHGTTDVCYFKNGLSEVCSRYSSSAGAEDSEKKIKPSSKKLKQFYSLCFTYKFEQPDTVYFAHAFPYTYTDLQAYLQSLQMDERISQFTRRKLLCATIAGNRCDVLTITARSNDIEESIEKPAVIISARIHPGETNSSFAMHGFIEYIVADTVEARALRQRFVFKVVPMLNPDGVVHGNYRCSLAGTDLNRRYNDMYPYMYPTVMAMRNLLQSTQQKRGVLLYLDLHGHSKNKNAFVYGCDLLQMPEKQLRSTFLSKSSSEIATQRVFCRLFPKVLCTVSNAFELPVEQNAILNEQEGENSVSALSWKGKRGFFSYPDCSFSVKKSKFGTGRVVSWRQMEIEGSYTIEISFCSVGVNDERRLLKRLLEGRALRCMDGPLNSLEALLSFLRNNTANGVSETDINALKDLVHTYATDRHFSKDDLLRVGEDIGLAIFHFANLQHENVDSNVRESCAASRSTKMASSSDTGNGLHDDRKQSNWTSASPGKKNSRQSDNSSPISTYGPSMLQKALPDPFLFSGNAFSHVRNEFPEEFHCALPTEHACLRFKCEQAIRKTLGLEFIFMARPENVRTSVTNNQLSQGDMINTTALLGSTGAEILSECHDSPSIPSYVASETFSICPDAQYESGDDGSESDPSVDNVPVSRLAKEMGSIKSPEALIAAIRLAEAKKRSKEERAEKELAKETEIRRQTARQQQYDALKRAKSSKKVSDGKDAGRSKKVNYTMNTMKRTSVKSITTPHVPVYRLSENRTKSPVLIQISALDSSCGGGGPSSGRGLRVGSTRPSSAHSFLKVGDRSALTTMAMSQTALLEEATGGRGGQAFVNNSLHSNNASHQKSSQNKGFIFMGQTASLLPSSSQLRPTSPGPFAEHDGFQLNRPPARLADARSRGRIGES